MSYLARAVRQFGPDPSELLPLRERMSHVEVLRACFAAVILTAIVTRPDLSSVDDSLVAAITGGYLALSAVPFVMRRTDVRHVLAVVQGMLLVDGIYLAWIILVTGGGISPLRFLLYVHVIVVTLLVSYRTGLKLAAWHSLLFLVVVQAHSIGIAKATVGVAAAEDGSQLHVALTLAALWMIALATATFSAVNERELRRQKADLNRLAQMTIAIDGVSNAGAIPDIVLDALVEAFGFTRGLVLASPTGELELVGATEGIRAKTLPPGRDRVMEEAWSSRQPQLVRRLDPETDPRLAALLPDARNVLLVPLTLNQGHRLGVVALEHARARDGMRRWEISMAVQYASHAALALHNAWLTEEREAQVEEIQMLQRELVAHNARLEVTVAERTEELRKVIKDLEETDEQRRSLLSHVVRAQEDERTRIANDIHDDPLQKLVAAKMRVELLQRAHKDVAELDDVHETVRSCITSLRFLLFDLRPPILDEQGLGPAVEDYLQHSGGDATFTVRDELLAEVPAETRVLLYRIAQEALTNARKHAEARHVDVELEAQDDGVLMRIEDDGVGFSPLEVRGSKPGHLGLAAMRERAEMAGGRIHLHSLPGAGTVLEVWLPLEREAVAAQPDKAGAPPEAAGAAEDEEPGLGQLLAMPVDRSA
jgi:signal transduction histidine kinase